MRSMFQYRYRALSDKPFPPFMEYIWFRCIPVIGIIISATSCFYIGRLSAIQQNPTSELQFQSTSRIFKYDRLFGSHPSPESNHAWLHLFPSGAGFFQHPTIAPKRSAFATFHQLHCLDGIRHGYWALYDVAKSGEGFNESSLPMMASPPHIRHCIDLLRQALMCRPDLTVEVKDEELGGVTGFGTRHECLDWGELVSWTRKWQD